MTKKMFRDILFLILYSLLLAIVIVKIDAVIGFLLSVFALLSPLLIGGFIAVLLNRPNKKLYLFYRRLFAGGRDRGYCRGLSIVTVYLLFLAVIAAIIWVIVPQFADSFAYVAANLEGYYHNAAGTFEKLAEEFHINLNTETLEGNLASFLNGFQTYISDSLTKIVGMTTGLVSAVTNFIFGLIFSVYLLLDKNRLIYQGKNLIHVFLPDKFGTSLISSLGKISRILQDYLGVRLMTGLFSGVFCFIGMTVFRFEYALLVSTLVGVMTVIPVFGPWFGSFVCLILSLLVYPQKAVWLLILYWTLYLAERFLVFPHLLDRETDLPALWRILSVSFFGAAFGFKGMMIAIPLTAFVYSALAEWIAGRERGSFIRKDSPKRVNGNRTGS